MCGVFMRNTVIEMKDVQKIYQMGAVNVLALDDVNLKIKKNEFLAITGPSGSGKSTLLHMIGLLDRPTSGDVFIENKKVSHLNESDLARMRGMKIGFVFQYFNLYPTLTAMENIELPMMIVEKDRKETRERAMELLKVVGLENRADRLPSQLSGGERQRVAVARALANNPPLILADEPTGNLDTKNGTDIMKFLKNLQETHKITIVIVTHEKQIANYAEKIIHLKDGKIIGG